MWERLWHRDYRDTKVPPTLIIRRLTQTASTTFSNQPSGFSSLAPLCLVGRAQECLRTVAENLRRTDKADRVLQEGNASVCTSRAMALGFFAHKARRNSSMLAQSAAASSLPCCRSCDEKPL